MTNPRVTLVVCQRALGIPGWDHAALLHRQHLLPDEIGSADPHDDPTAVAARVNGDILAFLDSTSTPHRGWLAAAVAVLSADASIAAVAPLIFDAAYPLMLQGAGNTLTTDGALLQCCADEPYEFATLPGDVLSAARCGMVARRAVLESIGPLDPTLAPTAQDVELGLRIWASGRRVVLSSHAWVERDSETPVDALSQRDRLALLLGYFPLGRAALALMRQPADWLWSLQHLPRMRAARRRFATGRRCYRPLVVPSAVAERPTLPRPVLSPAPAHADAQLTFEEGAREDQLGFGWYGIESDRGRRFRPTAPHASGAVRLPAGAVRCRIVWRAGRGLETVTLTVRRWGDGQPTWMRTLAAPPESWEYRRLPCALAAGDYEVLVLSAPPQRDRAGRARGVDIATIAFDSAATAA